MDKKDYRQPIKVFTPLLRVERVMFSILDIKLPFPVPVRQAGFFFLGLGIMGFLTMFPFIGSLLKSFWFISYLLIPGLIAYYLDKSKHDGKPPLIYLIDRFIYTFQKGRYNRYERIEKLGKSKFTGAIGFRKGEEIK